MRPCGIKNARRRAGRKEGEAMSRYDRLLIELLERLDEKADKLISLLEIRQGAENSSSDGAQVDQQTPDKSGT